MSKFLNITRSLVLLAMAAAFTTTFASGQMLNKADLKQLVATASTPEDHERLAKHFDAKAAQLDEDAAEHQELAAEYTRNPTGHEQKHPMSGQTAGHCKYLATKFRDAAKDARLLAADHRQMAKAAKTK